MPKAILPWKLKQFQQSTGTDYNSLLGEPGSNAKTNKNLTPTFTHNLSPADTSGAINVCPGAGNCKKTCLHWAGNPAYMKGKQAKRIRQTIAFSRDQNSYLEMLSVAIVRALTKFEGRQIAVRLNTTSDIKWEDLGFNLSPDVADFISKKFGVKFFCGRSANLLELFDPFDVVFYDYTKLKRNWQKCRDLNYHLTASFDGHSNSANHKVCVDAINSGVNVAAAFNIKKSEPFPERINLLGFSLPVLDGDISDSRFDDVTGGCLIGLRFKQPRSTKYSAEDVASFCI
tara:strand:- start:209 stop:1066 length:858 start_codon:yes stop_codon:yes gene_type:complete